MSMLGKSLVHYEITAEIGKGGMGEVYQAKDTKLGRDVAIKVLPEEFATDSDRVARFKREAKLLASLNHPNIAAIHGLEESDGTHFLVMELIEGDTLRDRIKSGPIPVEEALKLALQMAEALEAAHENGVIHRDLKPANIKITPDGKVKILDFGLAKAYAGDQEKINLADSPTISAAAATQQGVILGTAAYMSPEQAKGKNVDKRADIWAFGVVLFEMLTGRQLFTGETASETLASVMKSEPEWENLPPNLHSRIRFLLERCLKKDPRDRYSGISDARVEIKSVLSDPSGIFSQLISTVEPRRNLRSTLASITAAVILTAIIVGVAVWMFKPAEPRRVMRSDYDLPEDQQLMELPPPLNISPDGKHMVYCTTDGLYMRSMDQLNPKLIPGSEERIGWPFFSPDGKSIAYYSMNDGKLKRIAIEGGAPTVLCNVGGFRGGSWNEEGFIVYSDLSAGIMKISSNGGTPENLLENESGVSFNPHILPDGKSLIYTVAGADFSNPRIIVKRLKSEEKKELCPGWFIRYLPSGHLIYGDIEDNICAVQFDLDKLEALGDHVPMVPGVDDSAISDSGTLIYTLEELEEGSEYTLVWVNREGKEEPLDAPPDNYDAPSISPDGKQIALVIGSSGSPDIWIWDILRKNLNRLTLEETREFQPVWTSDSNRIIYYSTHESENFGGIYWRPFDGSGKIENLASESDRALMPWSVSRDGKILLMQEVVTMTNGDIGMLSMGGDFERKPLLQEEYSEAQPMISPDGRLMAYISSESTGEQMESEVYIRPIPEVDKRKIQVSYGGGNCPLWSPDGKELFYLSADNYVMAVTVNTEPTLSLGTSEQLFENRNLSLIFGRGYPWDIHPDGDRFLMIKPPPGAGVGTAAGGPRKIIVVTNWFEELKERVPVD